jgi:hypothetical protein
MGVTYRSSGEKGYDTENSSNWDNTVVHDYINNTNGYRI